MSIIPIRTHREKYVFKEREKSFTDAFDYFAAHTESEAAMCKHFGCGRKLCPQEYLFSDKCFFHQNINICQQKNQKQKEAVVKTENLLRQNNYTK